MSPSDDLNGDMAFFSATDRSEHLVREPPPGSELRDESARLARLLTALRSPTAPDEAGEQQAVTSIVAAIAAAPTPIETGRRSPMKTSHVTAKVAAITGAILLVGTGAAAATGTLPGPAQRAVSDALERVNVSVPHPDTHADGHAAGAPGSHSPAGGNAAAVGPDASGAAMRGLCTAWTARGKADTDRGASANSVAFTNLRHAAHDAGLFVKDYCHDVLTAEHPPSTVGSGSDGATNPGTNGESHSNAGDHQPSGDNGPAVETPNSGGIDTGGTASGDKNSKGTDHSAPVATTGRNTADTRSNSHATGH